MTESNELVNYMDPETIWMIECSLCYESIEIEEIQATDAAEQAFSHGWRICPGEKVDDVIVDGPLCPNCNEKRGD